MIKAATVQRVEVQGEVFGARGCSSCSCDPCDCNPCSCGSGLLPSYPHWRVSGYLITKGEIQSIDVSARLLLCLALPAYEGNSQIWQEVLLVEEQATNEQIHAMLTVLEGGLESIPAEVEGYTRKQRAVYKIPMNYTRDTEEPVLHAAFTSSQAVLVRNGTDRSLSFKEWFYDGPVVRRTTIQLHQ